MSFSTETEEEVDLAINTDASHIIMLYNDDHNTFDHVIESLVQVCGHSEIQAEQVALIVHTRGKCDVKRGSFEKLHPLCKKLQNKGLSAVIEP